MELTDLQRLKKIVKWLIFSDFGDNEKEIAELLGYKKTSFSQIMNGKVPISDKFIDKLISLDKNINKVWIKTGQGKMLLGDNNNILTNRDNHGVNNTGDMDNSNITINQGYTREQNKENIAENQEFNNEIILLLKAQLKDKDKMLSMQERENSYLLDKIADLEQEVTQLKRDLELYIAHSNGDIIKSNAG